MFSSLMVIINIFYDYFFFALLLHYKLPYLSSLDELWLWLWMPGGLIPLGLIEGDDDVVTGVEFSELLLFNELLLMVVGTVATGGDRAATDKFCG